MSSVTQFRVDPSTFVDRVRDNEIKLRRLRELELALISARNLREICQRTAAHFHREDGDDCDVVLTLGDPDGVIEHLLVSAGDIPAATPGLRLVRKVTDLTRLAALGDTPKLIAGPAGGFGWMLPRRAPIYRSVAVVPLAREGKTIGALGIASQDPERFVPNDATDFLAGFAAVYALCVENLLVRQQLELASTTDALTGLRNRRFLDARIVDELARSGRSGSPFSLVLLDVDHFKRINDEFGHPAGDAVLRDVAKRLTAAVRRADIVCRYGGEEFAVLMPDTDAARAREVAERIRVAIAGRQFASRLGLRRWLTVSGGVATQASVVPNQVLEDIRHALYAQSDAALYEAKEAGRNKVVVANGRSSLAAEGKPDHDVSEPPAAATGPGERVVATGSMQPVVATDSREPAAEPGRLFASPKGPERALDEALLMDPILASR